ncbi:MAG: hypothetical protein ACRELV_12280 [Longimicrobiales bacterium]
MSNRRRLWWPFILALAGSLVVVVALFRLPESFVSGLERGRPFTTDQAQWAFRLLLAAALIQALAVGFLILRPDRIRRALDRDERIAALPRADLAALLARNAAGIAALTLVYGLSAFAVSGERGYVWPFLVLLAAQFAWYARLVGEIAEWLRFQEPPRPARERDTWRREPPDYCPPLARGLVRTVGAR